MLWSHAGSKTRFTGFDAFEAFHLASHILQDEVCRRAVGCGEGHVHVYRMVVLHVHLVNHTEVKYVDWYLWVVHCFEYIHDSFFQYCFLLLSHELIIKSLSPCPLPEREGSSWLGLFVILLVDELTSLQVHELLVL